MNVSDEPQEKKTAIALAIDPQTAQGQYTNLMWVNHTPFEFTLDFAHLAPGMPVAPVRARVIVSPPQMKRIVAALTQNLKDYEERFGVVPTDPNEPEIIFERGN